MSMMCALQKIPTKHKEGEITMRTWTLETAKKALIPNAAVGEITKIINAPNGLNGLKQCSAADYLRKQHGYTYVGF
jgi:hypothetical protein